MTWSLVTLRVRWPTCTLVGFGDAECSRIFGAGVWERDRERLLLLGFSLRLLERSRRLIGGLRVRECVCERERVRSRSLGAGGLRDSEGSRSLGLMAALRATSRRLTAGL